MTSQIISGPRTVVAADPPGPLVNKRNQALSGGSWVPRVVRAPGSGEVTVDTAAVCPDTRYGTGTCVRFGTADAGWDALATFEFPAAVTEYDPVLSMLVYVDALDTAANGNYSQLPLSIELSNDVAANTYTNKITAVQNVICGRWNYVTFGGMKDTVLSTASAYEAVGWAVSGTGTANSPFYRLSLSIGGLGGNSPNVYVKQIHWGGKTKKRVVLSNDDGYSVFYTDILPLLEKYRLRCTASIISALVGTAGYATLAQLRDAKARGVSIGPHTVNHVTQAAATAYVYADWLAEIQPSKEYCDDNELGDEDGSSAFLAQPYGLGAIGKHQANYVAACIASGIVSSRSTIRQAPGFSMADPWDTPCLIIANDDAATAPHLVCRRIQQMHAGQLLRIGFHKVGSASNSLEYTSAGLEQIFRCLREGIDAGQLEVVTEAELYNELQGTSLLL